MRQKMIDDVMRKKNAKNCDDAKTSCRDGKFNEWEGGSDGKAI